VVRDAFFALLREWDRSPSRDEHSDYRPGQEPGAVQSGSLPTWLRMAQDAGWRRRDVYDLVWEVFRTHADVYSDDTLDALGEFETALTGACHPASVVRFPGDPESSEGVAAVARDPARW
jgi:hypothetical protein